MKILVISDTHGKIEHVKALIEEWSLEGVTHIVHCGDYIKDAKSLEKGYPDMEFVYVPGNCDFGLFQKDKDQIVTIEGVCLFITHGDRHYVKMGYENLYTDAASVGANIAICGHSHIPHYEKKEEIVLLNPGSVSYPRDGGSPSYAIIEIQGEMIKKVEIFRLNIKSNIL